MNYSGIAFKLKGDRTLSKEPELAKNLEKELYSWVIENGGEDNRETRLLVHAAVKEAMFAENYGSRVITNPNGFSAITYHTNDISSILKNKDKNR